LEGRVDADETLPLQYRYLDLRPATHPGPAEQLAEVRLRPLLPP
jgi:hypothetical protein